MIKKIRYYKTVSPTEMYISIERLSYILFGFSGKFENVDGKRRFSKYQKIISMDIENGFIDFKDILKIHSKDPRKRRELPKNENDAKKLCNDFFIEKGNLIKNDPLLRENYYNFFDNLNFISAFPIQNNIYENPRIDHWECHFNVDLKVSDDNNEKAILKNSSIIIKLANNGRVIAFHYHYLPTISYRFAERIETSQTEIINFYQNKVKNLQNTQPTFLNFLLELNDKVDKLMELPDEKLSKEKKEEFDHLMVHAFDKSDSYGMTYRVPYFKGRQKFLKGLDKETSDLYMEDSDKVNQKIVFLTDKVTNSIFPYYKIIDIETKEETFISATKHECSPPKEIKLFEKNHEEKKAKYDLIKSNFTDIANNFEKEINNEFLENFSELSDEKKLEKPKKTLSGDYHVLLPKYSDIYKSLTNIVRKYGKFIFNKAAEEIQKNIFDDYSPYATRLRLRIILKELGNKIYKRKLMEKEELIYLINFSIDELEWISRGMDTVDFAKAEEGTKKILISGFDVFQDGETNPSALVAWYFHNKMIKDKGKKALVQSVIFPVRYKEFDNGWVERFFGEYINKVDVIINLGVGAEEGCDIQVERLSGNYRGAPISDNENIHPSPQHIKKDSPNFYETSLLLEKDKETGKLYIFHNLFEMQHTGEVNDSKLSLSEINLIKGKIIAGSGGDFFCNEMFYRVAHLKECSKSIVKQGFIHMQYVENMKVRFMKKYKKFITTKILKS